MKKGSLGGVARAAGCAVAGLWLTLAAAAASANIYLINSTADTSDANLLDELCDDGTGACTLRAAIEQSNDRIGLDEADFDLAGSPPYFIRPASALPPVADGQGMIIDATTQPGWAGEPLVVLEGSNAGPASGLRITLGHSAVMGLVIYGFQAHGMVIQGSHLTDVFNCWIGLDETGTSAPGNGVYGLFILDSQQNSIGAPGKGNVIAGNPIYEIYLSGGQAWGNLIESNLLGTDKTGTVALGVGIRGILVNNAFDNFIGGPLADEGNIIASSFVGIEVKGAPGSGNTIQGNRIGTDITGQVGFGHVTGVHLNGIANTVVGGAATGAGNLISGNLQYGIEIEGAGAIGNQVLGNLIGVAADGVTPMANGRDGIYLHTGVTETTIGTPLTGDGNLIAHNRRDGIRVESGSGNRIQANSIRDNTGLGIDLGGDGVTANDPGDVDSGVNGLQNFPVLGQALARCSTTVVEGTLDTNPDAPVDIDFYANTACDPSGNGEAAVYLGTYSDVTDAAGALTFSAVLPVTVTPGQLITATATATATHDSSELSACRTAIDDCGGGCNVANILAIGDLLAVKDPTSRDDVVMTWRADAEANDGYDVWFAIAKADVPACTTCPGSQPVLGCQPTGGALLTSCTHAGAISDPLASLFFYEVRGVCGGVEAAR